MINLDFSGIASATVQEWLGIFDPSERVFILHIMAALGMAWFIWRLQMRKEGRAVAAGIKNFLSYIFNPALYKHKSSWQDYAIFFINGFLYYTVLAQLVLSAAPIADLVMRGLMKVFGPPDHPLLPEGFGGGVIATVFFALLFDFSAYLAHYLTHKVPVLWALHKVHHSAEVLTPVTSLRFHPVDLLLQAVTVTLLLGGGLGVYFYLEGAEEIRIFEVNAIVFIYYLAGYHLRHSHVWLHYPAWLSRFLVSPAQHQIHHSVAPRHRDKNLGLIFSFWDRMFGTLYLPKEREEIVYGINSEEHNPYSSVKEVYLRPLREGFGALRSPPGEKKIVAFCNMTGVVSGFIAFILFFHMISLADVSLAADGKPVDPPSLYLEDLTWTEIYQAQHNGYDTVIIPSGGTEQNGPHMVLGKHNYIIRYTTGEIAKRLGNTLVAPVIAYVPEGDIMPSPTKNMQWTGTTGIPPQVMEDVLYWAAFSFKQHGFKYIYFIGDHGGDIAPQQRVAGKLTALWKKDGVLVANISQYYDPSNGQVHWLQKQGFKDFDIGLHAAIRDTSELMYVHPEGVRADPLIIPDRISGVWGNPFLATKEIGKKMIELKVDAAVKEIRDIRATGKAPPCACDVNGP